MFKFFILPHFLQINYYKADSGGGLLWIVIIIIVLFLMSKGSKKNNEIISCHYCQRRVKRMNLVKGGQCPFCGNQVE